ncbi:MAG: serine/threonine-protein kinase [Acidobacteriota bacterium]|nr:serine/threonine-protein kinase [Acidobacteriota bacterium]
MQRFGRYEVVEKVGSGGMGVVYKAADPSIDRTVALKVLPAGDNGSAELRARFQREARAAGRLQHPNIVVIYDIGEQDGSLYIAMEFLEGQTLADRIATQIGPPDVSATVDIMAQVARGLHYAHERGVVHRDIKPANILVTREGIAKILDFGIARAAGDQRITKTLQVMGTVFYMSPEQINGQQLDGRSDIFSAGIVLYELLTGAVPFEADSTGATMMKILTAAVPPLSGRVPVSPGVLDDLLHTALAKKPEERFVSAANFAKALDAAKKICEEKPHRATAAAVSAYSAPEIAPEVAPALAPTVVHPSNPLRTPPAVSPPTPTPLTPIVGVPIAETAPERMPSPPTPASSPVPLHKRLWVRYVFLVVVIIAAVCGIVALNRSPGGGNALKVTPDVKPETAEVFYQRAAEHAKTGDLDRAITELNEAIRIKPDYAEAFYDRGGAYYSKREYDRAIQDYDAAIRLRPDAAIAFCFRGMSYSEKGEYDRAIQDLDQAIRLAPEVSDYVKVREETVRRKAQSPP